MSGRKTSSRRAQPAMTTATARFLRELESLHGGNWSSNAYSAYWLTGQPALFWRAYQQERVSRGVPSEQVLRTLDWVVASILSARSDGEIVTAVGLGRNPRGGPGKITRGDAALRLTEVCCEIWAEACRIEGRSTPHPGLPARLPPGVFKAVAMRMNGQADKATLQMLRQRWSRWRRAVTKRGVKAVDLQAVSRVLAGR